MDTDTTGTPMSKAAAPVRLLRPKTAYVQAVLVGGYAGHAFYLLTAAVFAGWPLVGAFNFNDVVVIVLGFVASLFIAVLPICMTGLIAAPMAWGVHRLLSRAGLDYRVVCIGAGAPIALVSVNLFFGLSDGVSQRMDSISGLSVVSALLGGAIAGQVFWRQAVRPLLNHRPSP